MMNNELNYELSQEEKKIFINNFINQSADAANNYDKLKSALDVKGKIIYWDEKYKVTPLMFLLGFNKGRYNDILKDKEQEFRNIFSHETYDFKIKNRQFVLSGNATRNLKFKVDNFYLKDIFGHNILHYGSSNANFKAIYLTYVDNITNNYAIGTDEEEAKRKNKTNYIDYKRLEDEADINNKNHMFYMLLNTNVQSYELKSFTMDLIRFQNHSHILLGILNNDIKKLTEEEKISIKQKCMEFKDHIEKNKEELAIMEKTKQANLSILQIKGRTTAGYENETNKMIAILDYLILSLEDLPENNINKSKKPKI